MPDEVVLTLSQTTGLPMVSLRGPWRNEYTRYFASDDYAALELNGELGFSGGDLEFLVSLPSLRELVVISGVVSDRGVRHCVELTHLALTTASADVVDFSEFARLQNVYLGELKGKESILSLRGLESLYLYGYPDQDLRPLDRLAKLRRLQLGPARRLITLDGLERLTTLTLLGIYHAPQLRSIDLVSAAALLEELELDGCRAVSDVSAVGNLRSLRRLLLVNCGRISSLRPLHNCPQLETVLFYGTTNVADGDLSVLDSLSEISFQNRRHYNRRRESLPGWE